MQYIIERDTEMALTLIRQYLPTQLMSAYIQTFVLSARFTPKDRHGFHKHSRKRLIAV